MSVGQVWGGKGKLKDAGMQFQFQGIPEKPPAMATN